MHIIQFVNYEHKIKSAYLDLQGFYFTHYMRRIIYRDSINEPPLGYIIYNPDMSFRREKGIYLYVSCRDALTALSIEDMDEIKSIMTAVRDADKILQNAEDWAEARRQEGWTKERFAEGLGNFFDENNTGQAE